VYKHLKPSRQNPQGGRLSKEMPIDVSNVMLYCSTCRRGVRVGRRYGAEVPFLRPRALAGDRTHTPPVVEHAVRHLERHDGLTVGIVVTLQPTSPFRAPRDINAAVRLLAGDARLDSVISVTKADFPPHWMLTMHRGRLRPLLPGGDHSIKERQELPAVYRPNGAVYATRRRLLAERGLIFSAFAGGATGYVEMDALRSLDIDGPLDLIVARLLVKEHPELVAR
jgi:CMP-N-acetylneuraminic acid synthetase